MLGARGLGLADLLAVLAVVGISVCLSLPALARLGMAARASAAARDLALDFHAMRWKSVSLGVGHGLLFERDASGWSWRCVRDGNANGLRVADIADGTDVVVSGPHRLSDRHRDVRLGFPPGGAVPAIPPGRGSMSAGDDPVRFGPSDLVAFTPLGTSSSGTIYLTDGNGTAYAVRLYGVTSRVRVWRYTRESGRWKL